MTIIPVRRYAAVLAAVAFLAFAWSPVAAQGNAVGQIKKVSGQTQIERAGAKVAARMGDPVYAQDVIETGADGSIGITFVDNTTMSAGPNSEISLDEYRFDSSNFNGAMTTNVRKGTLSMVSGDIARSSPGAMKVRTPTATMGVRGTSFVVQVQGNP